ncbi:hypothetical protein EDD21DRAFT_355825 [Dissophora ornata]|nr:hypothetical protein EDD21DRAFT_355825 [Dissophora ornata]
MTATRSTSTPHTKNVFRLHGVNVLNRKNVDSIARLTALERRRATHILDERQRRDTMNQLLAELANLVRESASEVDPTQQQQQQQHQQPQPQSPPPPPSPSPQPATLTLNPDGTEKRPAVKSNSITTLRNAIAEIRRLRVCTGLSNSSNKNQQTTTPGPTPWPSSSSTSPSLSELDSLSTLAELASQHCGASGSWSDSNSVSGSCSSSPMSSPKSSSHLTMSPTEATAVTAISTATTAPAIPTVISEHSTSHVYSPPLSPTSPSSQLNFLETLPALNTNITTSSSSTCAPTLPPLYTIVQSMPYHLQHRDNYQYHIYPPQAIHCGSTHEPSTASSRNSESLSPSSYFPEPSIAHSPHLSSAKSPSSSIPPL